MKNILILPIISSLLISGCFFKKKKDPFYSGNIPQSFICFDMEYELDFECTENKGDWIGWLINQEDYYKWVEIDNNPTIVYGVAPENSLYRPSDSEIFRNRCKLYKTSIDEHILCIEFVSLYFYSMKGN